MERKGLGRLGAICMESLRRMLPYIQLIVLIDSIKKTHVWRLSLQGGLLWSYGNCELFERWRKP
jgi:hypothetical protein